MLSSYEYCKRKLFLNYVLDFWEPVKKSTSLGTIRHETYDKINKIEEKLVKSIKHFVPKNDLIDLYQKEYRIILADVIRNNKKNLEELNLNLGEIFRQVWPLILDESQTRASALFEFIQMNSLYGEELWEKLSPKIHSEVRIESENLNLKGIIDQLEVYKTGIVPIELKTGSCPKEGVWPGHRLQVAAYALLTQEKFNQEVKEAFVFYLDHKERRHIAINLFMLEEIKDLTKKVDSLLNSLDLPEIVTNTNKCQSCGLKDICSNDSLLKEKIKNKSLKSTNINN
jgi:CRISPR-associated protein Cas4